MTLDEEIGNPFTILEIRNEAYRRAIPVDDLLQRALRALDFLESACQPQPVRLLDLEGDEALLRADEMMADAMRAIAERDGVNA